jgi:hypothetical protein
MPCLPSSTTSGCRTVVVVFSIVVIAVTAVDVVQYTVDRASVLSPISGCA